MFWIMRDRLAIIDFWSAVLEKTVPRFIDKPAYRSRLEGGAEGKIAE